MTTVYLVRHGQPDFAGNYDSITDLGARQSGWLGQHFAANGLVFDRLVSGTLHRQVATLEHIAAALPAPVQALQDARLNEYDHLGLLQLFEGDRLPALRAAGDRRAYFAAIRSALQRWSLRRIDVLVVDAARSARSTAASVAQQWVVRRRIDRLDMIEVLKTRE